MLAEVAKVFEEIEEECASEGGTAVEKTSLEYFEKRFGAFVEGQARYAGDDLWRIFRYFANRQACIDGGYLEEQAPSQCSSYRELVGPLLVRVPGGYSTILRHMVERLPEGTCRTSMPVETVNWSGLKASVTVKGGEVVEAEHVIVTSSLGVLKAGSIRFDPPLPSVKQEAISRMGMGKVEKVFFLFSDEQWQNFGQLGFSQMNILLPLSPPPPSWISRTTGFFRLPDTNYAFTWVTGTAACAQVASSSDDELVTDLQEWLVRFYPEGRADDFKAASVVKSGWACNEWIQGSYSFPCTWQFPSGHCNPCGASGSKQSGALRGRSHTRQ